MNDLTPEILEIKNRKPFSGENETWWHCPECNARLTKDITLVRKGMFAYCTYCEVDYKKDQCKLIHLKRIQP